MKKLKYIRIEKGEADTYFSIDDVLNPDDYLSLLENEPSLERRLVIINVMLDAKRLSQQFGAQRLGQQFVFDSREFGTAVNAFFKTGVLSPLSYKEKFRKYIDEMKTFGISEELVIRYNRQNNIDEILGADTNSREE